ncbi:MAG TPA: sigma-70 family RNA polymerase sigma factor [Myxococcota bacterium]|nr:sigma-70 family RNA polymerase sigma factor [Myxococcota bacterium]
MERRRLVDPGARPQQREDREAALLARIARHDEAALMELYEAISPMVYACCLRILGDPDEAKDVTSQTFWRLWSRAGDYEPNLGSARAWILTVGRRLALDQRRRLLRRGHTLARLETRPLGGWDVWEQTADRIHVSAALGRLSPGDRSLLESVYFEGLSGSDIARRDHVPLGTVKSRMRAALRHLRSALKGGWRR